MMSNWKIAVSASALLLLAGCEDRGGADRRAGGTGSSAEAAGQRASGPQATAQGATTATGQVVSAKSDELVLKQQGQDKELKLKVGPQTQVLIDGKQSTIDNLREGAQVRASYDASQGEPRATRIEALGGAGGGAGDRPGGSAGTTGGLGGSSSATPGQTGGPGGESSTSASQPGAPTGTERGSGSGTQPGSR
jgi:hypothetical protein